MEKLGPCMHHVDPNKTIKAPYSQGDVVVFGQNAGQQCVAMSLCALIYHNMKGIGNPDVLKHIMHIENQLYSSLSQLSRQSFLLLTDLPLMLTVLKVEYQLEYNERAFESLISERYSSFILTVGCIAVGISYYADNGHFKVFDLHATDVYGKSHAQGTCVLLDISSTDNLVHYFQSLYEATDLYELKGLQITIINYQLPL